MSNLNFWSTHFIFNFWSSQSSMLLRPTSNWKKSWCQIDPIVNLLNLEHTTQQLKLPYLHLIFAILQFEIHIEFDELNFFPSLNLIFLPVVACKIQVWNRPKIKFIKLDISKWRIAKNQVQIYRGTWLLNLPLL